MTEIHLWMAVVVLIVALLLAIKMPPNTKGMRGMELVVNMGLCIATLIFLSAMISAAIATPILLIRAFLLSI